MVGLDTDNRALVFHPLPIAMNKSSRLATVCNYILILIALTKTRASLPRSSLELEHLKKLFACQQQCGWLNFTRSEVLAYQLNYSLPVLSIQPEQSSHVDETTKLGQLQSHVDQQISSQGYLLSAYNLLVSNRIGLFRGLPDTRNRLCARPEATHRLGPLVKRDEARSEFGTGNSQAYQASIIICYYNEPPSALLRTIWSVLARSPSSLLHEIILIDDFSEPAFHLARVKPFITEQLTRSQGKVKLLRTSKREGLIRARLLGANQATGSALVFLDSHVEPNLGWLEPLLETLVQSNGTAIACPMIDLINSDTLIYSASPMVRGGLSWDLHFKWDSVPADQLRTGPDFVRPIETPTMAGGLYAIDRHFFHHLGAYDPGMDLWGGENVELSLRVWMCGGRILILPCSRVGHIFRKRRPYGPAKGAPDTLLVNSLRAAKVWLDGDHLHRFYLASPEAKSVSHGQLDDRLELRRRLKCRDFTWFLDNVYPEMNTNLRASTDSEKLKLFSMRPRPS